jgi:RNA polymerase sigma factor (sigma-70 family)
VTLGNACYGDRVSQSRELPQETCWTLVRAATGGDGGARSLFAQSYATPIRAYLRHRWSSAPLLEHVDDAMQDIFVECFKPSGVLERADPENGEFRALLYAVARNVARRYEERRSRTLDRAAQSIYLDELPGQEEALSRFFDRSWAQSIVRDAVLRHAQAARKGKGGERRRYRILRMRHQDGLPIREIAARIDEPNVDSVHNDYRRARREFRVFLRQAVAQHTGASPAALDAECRRITELLGS